MTEEVKDTLMTLLGKEHADRTPGECDQAVNLSIEYLDMIQEFEPSDVLLVKHILKLYRQVREETSRNQKISLDEHLEILFDLGVSAISTVRTSPSAKFSPTLEAHLYNDIGYIARKLSQLAEKDKNIDQQKYWLNQSYLAYERAHIIVGSSNERYSGICCDLAADLAEKRAQLASELAEGQDATLWATRWYNQRKKSIDMLAYFSSPRFLCFAYHSLGDSLKLKYSFTMDQGLLEEARSYYETALDYARMMFSSAKSDNPGIHFTTIRILEKKIRVLTRWSSYSKDS